MKRLTGMLQAASAELQPGYFAMVMATGIVSIACHLAGLSWIAALLFRLNIGLFSILWLLLLARIFFHSERFLADLGDHSRGAGFFTTVAATCILGNQCIILEQAISPAIVLLALGTVLWAVLIYGIFALFTIRVDKPDLERGINGTWLVAVVATQSVSVLSGLVVSGTAHPQEVFLFFSLCTFLAGCMLYILIITLIFYRLMFFEFRPSDLSHPYWINMGAVAITSLAGTVLVMNAPGYPFLKAIMPFVAGFTLFFWATATWWIPFLLLLGVWRFVIHRQKIFYDPQYWSVVFPLGMYSTCTMRVAAGMNLEFLGELSRLFMLCALLSWVLLFLALLHSLAVAWRTSPFDS